MARVVFPETLDGGSLRHQGREWFSPALISLYVAVSLVVGVMVGLVVVLAHSGPDQGVQRTTRPALAPPVSSTSVTSPTTTTTTTSATVAPEPPPAETVPPPAKPVPQDRPTQQQQQTTPAVQVVTANQPCDKPGEFAVSSDYRPMVCSPSNPPRWQPLM